MKKSLLSGIVTLLILTSCEKIDNEVFFKIGSGLEYKFSDIELYDTSAHVLYFKKVHDEFEKIENGSFTFLDKGIQFTRAVFGLVIPVQGHQVRLSCLDLLCSGAMP